jgi:tetratricopeptide (TPR) repeat protein/O-antigen ligase
VPKRSRYRRYRIYLPTSLICLSPFLLGSVFPFLVLFLSLGLLFALWMESRVKDGLLLPGPGVGLVAVLLVALFGLVPLPEALLRWLSPIAAETREFILGSADWGPLSLDLPSTVLSALLCFAILLAFLVGANATQQGRRSSSHSQRWISLLSAIGGLGGLMVFVIAAHELNEVSAVYLFYPTSARLVGPLINPNNVAALCSFSALVALGVALHTSNSMRPWLVVSALFSISILPFTGSRGGVAAFVVGLFAFLLWEIRAKKGRRIAAATGISAGVVIFLFSLLWGRDAASLFLQDIKVSMWRSATQLANDFVWVGVGRGAFSDVFPRYQGFTEQFNVTSAEMLPLSILSETGLLGLFAAGFFVFAFIKELRSRAIDPAERGAIVAVFAALLHDLADFSLEIAGVALPVFFVVGVLSGRREGERKRGYTFSLFALSALLLPAVVWSTLNTAESAKSKIEAATSAAQINEITERELWLRPSDGYLSMAAAARLLVLREPRAALAYVNHARYLLPRSAVPRLLAARALRRLGRLSQARLEYRAAFVNTSDAIYREALEIAPGETELRQLVPSEPVKAYSLSQILREKRPREALNVTWGLAQAAPKDPEVWARLAEIALSINEPEEAASAAQVLLRLSDARGASMLSKANLQQKQPITAQAVLSDGITRWPNDKGLRLQLAEIQVSLREWDAALHTLDGASAIDPYDANIFYLRATALTGQERLQSALAAYQEGLRLSPRSISLRVGLAKLYETLGKNRDALSIYRELAQENSAYQREVERLQK